MLHRLNLRNETSQENESNINRKPVKSRNPLSYAFLPRKFCLVYKNYFHQKLDKQITVELIIAASWAKRRWKGLRETHLRSKRKFRSELKYQDMVRSKFTIEHVHIFWVSEPTH